MSPDKTKSGVAKANRDWISLSGESGARDFRQTARVESPIPCFPEIGEGVLSTVEFLKTKS